MSNKAGMRDVPGYEKVWIDGGQALLVPLSEVAAFRVLRTETRILAEETAKERVQKVVGSQAGTDETSAKDGRRAVTQSDAPSKPVYFDGPAPPGTHRIIQDMEELLRALSETTSGQTTPDADANARRIGLLKKLIEAGPYRHVGRPSEWRDRLASLERDMPNFAAPIASVASACALSEVSGTPVRIQPLLLLGSPGIGKTHFSNRLAEIMGVPHASIAFDQPNSGSNLRGSEAYYSNTKTGLLFNLICLGSHCNPLITLDELDKAGYAGAKSTHPLAQLHGALEIETAKTLTDVSMDVSFDASLVTYVATANSTAELEAPILSRFEIFDVRAPSPDESIGIAERLTEELLRRAGLSDRLRFSRRGVIALAHVSPRVMKRVAQRAIGIAVSVERREVGDEDIYKLIGLTSSSLDKH